jgi:antitoxin VapB
MDGSDRKVAARAIVHYVAPMLILPPETERLAQRLAAAQGVEPLTAVQRALEESARAVGVEEEAPPRRMTVEQILALAAEIAALPVLDPRSPKDIMDEINEV